MFDEKNYMAVATRHRDSPLLDNHHFELLVDSLKKVCPEDETDLKSGLERWFYTHDYHWLTGWIETLYILKGDNPLLESIEGILSQLEDYPIADEDEYYNKLHSKMLEIWTGMSLRDRLAFLREHKVDPADIDVASSSWPDDIEEALREAAA